MPFKKGIAPIRRTLDYLNAGKLKFNQDVGILTANWNVDQKASVGTYEFIFWHFPQLKYHNPNVQFLKLKNMTPTPFIQIFMNSDERYLIDTYDRTREEIHDHILSAFCEENYKGKLIGKKPWNPANFGHRCSHWCICEFPGQVPCPSYTELPKEFRGKYIFRRKDS